MNEPAQLARVLGALEGIRAEFTAARTDGMAISLADLIVLAGDAAVERAAANANAELEIPFAPGRTDATEAETDAASFAPLEPVADGFRNYLRAELAVSAEEMLVDRAQLLTLSAPEMTVLVGGLRVLGANHAAAADGAFTGRPGTLSNDFFANLLDMATEWVPAPGAPGRYEGRDRTTGELRWTGTRVDLVFGSNSQLRALAEMYACADGQQAFARDFAQAWSKVMNADRFDLAA